MLPKRPTILIIVCWVGAMALVGAGHPQIPPNAARRPAELCLYAAKVAKNERRAQDSRGGHQDSVGQGRFVGQHS